jgi:cytochrome c oxidase assembly factor CtaG
MVWVSIALSHGLVLLAAVYVSGLRDLARRGRLHAISRRHIASFASGLLALLLALESPLDTVATRGSWRSTWHSTYR